MKLAMATYIIEPLILVQYMMMDELKNEELNLSPVRIVRTTAMAARKESKKRKKMMMMMKKVACWSEQPKSSLCVRMCVWVGRYIFPPFSSRGKRSVCWKIPLFDSLF